jgi:type IV pilus assembly protein PilA
MRSAFTLVELMIVIAIIAIIAAIAIPNLLESRVTAQESAAAAALKTGVLPAEVQFQAGCYLDQNNNGLGEYAAAINSIPDIWLTLSGAQTISGVTLNLLSPTFNASDPTISGYVFQNPLTVLGSEEQTWAVAARPVNIDQGRRQFVINQAGSIYVAGPSATATGAVVVYGATGVYGASGVSTPSSASWKAYRR